MAVYSPDRVTRLRLVLGVVLAIAVLLALLAAFMLTDGDQDDRRAGVVGMVVAGVLLGAGGAAMRLLGDAERPAKIASIVTGVLVVLAGVSLAGSWLAFLLPLLGVGLLFLALLPDEPDGATR